MAFVHLASIKIWFRLPTGPNLLGGCESGSAESLRFLLDIGRSNYTPTCTFKIGKDFSKHATSKPLGLFERAFDCFYAKRVAKIGGNTNAHIPAIAAASFAASALKIGVVRQVQMPHLWHPLSNIRPNEAFDF